MQTNQVDDQPKITVITATYNCIDNIEITIDSVLNQTYNNIEYIVIDGYSSDGTDKLINNKYEVKLSKFVSERDRGISDAFNKGISYATGDLLFFLNAGDVILETDVFQRVVRKWNVNRPDVLFYQVVIGQNTIYPSERADIKKDVWDKSQLPHQGTFISKRIIDRVGSYNTALKIRMDYDYFARCRYENATYEYIALPIVRYQLGGASMKIENNKTFYREGLALSAIYEKKIYVRDLLMWLMPNVVVKIARNLIKR